MRKHLLLLSVMLTMAALPAFAQTVTGRVTSASDNSPLPGVSVVVKGTNRGTSTDADGNYSLATGGDEGTLVLSFIGYASQEVSLQGRTTVDVSLQEDISQLGEVVVTALGIKKDQKAIGYAVSTVSAEELTASGNTNFASALYGKAAGVKISTAPGGATSAVNVQIRGVNSLNYNGQPLYVVDGVLIRNTIQTNDPDKNSGYNNNGYWDDQRIRGNGILDVNPADIESLTILKGASATALYGSEAASGVIVITTKKGSNTNGLGIDMNYVYNVEEVAFTPKFQNTYGPGYSRDINLANGATEDGWVMVDLDGDGTAETQRPYFRAYGQFGPKMEGQLVPWWDGTTRAYSAQPDNYKDFYQTGYNSNFNVALSNRADKYQYRLSYTRYDYSGISRGSKMSRDVFNLNSSIKLHDKVTTDVVISYNHSNVRNRPEQIERISHNYGGFFSRADDMSVYLNKYQTSEGYKYVPYTNPERNPEEALPYNIRANDLLDYLWRNLRNSEEETQDRLISSITLNYDIIPGLRFRGRVGGDLTSVGIEKKEYNEYPVAFNTSNSTGNYRVSSGNYSILYADALLTYTKQLNPDFEFSVNGGIQARDEFYRDQYVGTNGGLDVENWFSISNSFNPLLSSGASRVEVLKYAYLGTLNLAYKNFLFLEGTARQEYSSTLPPKNNSFFYPSVNAGFVFTDAFQFPNAFSYGKLRASYGVVGTSPPPYAANILYSRTGLSTTAGAVPSMYAPNQYGNNDIRPENKYEAEFGLETRILENKIGLDVAYYTSRITDQILRTTVPASAGARSVLSNVGELRGSGLEIALNATPYSNGALTWNTRMTFAVNKTKAHKLANGAKRLIVNALDQDAVLVVADEGETIGDIYVHPRLTDADGNFVIDENGLYVMDIDNYKKVGNILPKAIGGWGNTVSYKGLSLDFMIDYRFGGKLVSTPTVYNTGAGMYENTMEYRDQANGGLPYYIDGGNNKILLDNHNSGAPGDARVWHDGILLDGVTATGEPNATIVSAADYYFNTFTWGNTGWYEKGAVLDNDYVKMREVVLSYNLPKSFAQKLKFQNLKVSLIGRNLFYLYRTLDNLDPEVAVGSKWNTQGIDEGTSAATRSYGFSINASF